MPLDPRARLGPYEIVSLAGAGGMGEIYKATDTRLHRTVAIKVLTPTLAIDPDVCERFEREARIVSQVDHPHICALYDIGTHEGTTYLVMPYLDGETLAARLQRGPLPIEGALKYGVEILDALNAAHHAGITHRDLKPANIMLTKSGVKLLDFGVAKLRPQAALAGAPPDAPTSTQPTPLTKAGTFVGTLHYMSPEQLEGHEGDPTSDIFAFGAVLYEMLSGRQAFEGVSQASVIAAIMERDVPRLNHAVAPPAVERLVRKCLAKDPRERWQTAKDLGDELRWVLESGAGTVGAAAPGERQADGVAPAAPTRSRRRRFIFRLTIGISVSVVIAAGLLGRRVIAPIDTPATTTADRVAPTSVTPPEQRQLQAATKPPAVLQGSPGSGRLAYDTSPPNATDFVTRLRESYPREVGLPCRTMIEGRYPFGDGAEMDPKDFGALFGFDGVFDKFFNHQVAPARQQLPTAVPGRFEQAARIRTMFFLPGSKSPLVNATVKVSNIDASTMRFVIGVGSQRLEARPGEQVSSPLVWTGAESESYVAFEDRVAAPETSRFTGSWSPFRLADSFQAGPLLPLFRVSTKYHSAQVAIETADPSRNPFAERDWRRFRCDP